MATRIYKKCTKCSRFYIEKDLLFCLKDGTTLMVMQDEENTSDQKAKTYMPSVLVSNKQNQTTQFANGQMSNTKSEVSAHWSKVAVSLQPTVSAETKQVKKEAAKANEHSQRQNNLLTTMVVNNKKNVAANNGQAKKSNGRTVIIAVAVVLMLLVGGVASIVVARSVSFKFSQSTGLAGNRDFGSFNVSVPNENDIEGKNKKRTTKTTTAPVNNPNQGEKKPADTTTQKQTTKEKTTATTKTSATQKTKAKTTTTRHPSTNQEETIHIGGNGIPIVVAIRVP